MTNVSQMSRFVYQPEQVRELDRIAIEEQGIHGYTLMTRAGQAAFDAIHARFSAASRWLILCGSGNNGGDGYVVARLAREHGIEVTVVALSPPEKLTGDAALAWQDFAATGGPLIRWSGANDLPPADLIIDAMLGTGLTRELSGDYRAAVIAVNEVKRIATVTVVAMDIATGLHGASGMVMGAAVSADLTVTFVGRKLGLYLAEGPDYSGEVVFADLAIEAISTDRIKPQLRVFGQDDFSQLMPRRVRTGHKGRYGHVLLIGGNAGMGGAVRLAGEAALRSGAGLVSVVTRADNVASILAGRPELMCRGIETTGDENQLPELLQKASVIALGPGLGQDDWARHMYQEAIQSGKPLVLDADALNLLAEDPIQRDDWILTPHPGEAGRLLQSPVAEIQADRPGGLQQLIQKYGGAVVLKGHGTLVAGAQEADCPWLIVGGNPGMATAGMGDVLTGITAAVRAQVGDTAAALSDIAAAAAWLHACAGDRAAARGERGLLASDLFDELRACQNR